MIDYIKNSKKINNKKNNYNKFDVKILENVIIVNNNKIYDGKVLIQI